MVLMQLVVKVINHIILHSKGFSLGLRNLKWNYFQFVDYIDS